jgi:cell division protease FtsH
VLELMDKETLDKEEVARVFEPLRRRSARPAWTGSPERNPSAIPPIEIPQEIRDRVRGNGVPGVEEGEGGVVITPPGSGGDVHGDPGLGAPPTTPPEPR